MTFIDPWMPKEQQTVANHGGLLIHAGGEDCWFAGQGITVTYRSADRGPPKVGMDIAEEGEFDAKGVGRRLNGDQTHQGRHIRLPPGKPQIRKVRSYRYWMDRTSWLIGTFCAASLASGAHAVRWTPPAVTECGSPAVRTGRWQARASCSCSTSRTASAGNGTAGASLPCQLLPRVMPGTMTGEDDACVTGQSANATGEKAVTNHPVARNTRLTTGRPADPGFPRG